MNKQNPKWRAAIVAWVAVSCTAAFVSQTAHSADNSHAKLILFELGPGVFSDFSLVDGSSVKLTRTEDEIWLRINAAGLIPGAYTNWWVIFNNPEECASNPCDGPVDLPNPDVGGAVFFAAGGIVGDDGVAKFRAHLEEGVEAGGIPDEILVPNGGNGLTDAQGAEIHYILRYHGPAVEGNPDLLMKQLNTSNGGCMIPNPPNPFQPPDPVVADRIFQCYDPYASVLPRP